MTTLANTTSKHTEQLIEVQVALDSLNGDLDAHDSRIILLETERSGKKYFYAQKFKAC